MALSIVNWAGPDGPDRLILKAGDDQPDTIIMIGATDFHTGTYIPESHLDTALGAKIRAALSTSSPGGEQ